MEEPAILVNNKRGVFIAVEGGDGSGKTTLVLNIEKWFSSRGLPIHSTREPSDLLRNIIKDYHWNPLAELLLFEADRIEHVKVLSSYLSSGINVLSDRFTCSTLAYQGYGRGLSLTLINQLNKLVTDGLEPDLVIWIKVDPEIANKRISDRSVATNGGPDRIDQEDIEFHTKVYQGYEKMAQDQPNRFIVIDGKQSPDQVFVQLLSHPLWTNTFNHHDFVNQNT